MESLKDTGGLKPLRSGEGTEKGEEWKKEEHAMAESKAAWPAEHAGSSPGGWGPSSPGPSAVIASLVRASRPAQQECESMYTLQHGLPRTRTRSNTDFTEH